MKRAIALSVCAICGLAAFAEQWDHWEFDASKKTVTDGAWTFNASKDGTRITVTQGSSRVIPDVVSPIDLTKPLADASDSTKVYTFYNWDPRLSDCSKVGDVNLNQEGLNSIGYMAFQNCVNATNELVFPSTLKSISSYPFRGTKLWMKGDALPAGLTSLTSQALEGLGIVGELDLTHVTTLEHGSVRYTNVGSVRFGPGTITLKNGTSDRGAFEGCTSLTNVVFDPDSSVIMQGAYIFPNCTALKKLDLSAVSSISLLWSTPKNGAPFRGCTKLTKIIFGHKLTTLPSETFYGATALTEIRFKGPPPATLGTPFLGEVPESQNVVTVVELDPDSTDYDYQEALTAWNALTAGGTINDTDSTWSAAAAGSCYESRPLLLAATTTMSAAKTADVDQSTVSSGAFVVSRGANDSVAGNKIVSYALSGTAVSGKDYVALSGSVTIPAGERSATIAVAPLYNAELTDPRTLTLTIQESEDYLVGTASATMTIFHSKAFAGWTYDPTAKTITRGNWTFNTTVSGTSITVGSCTVWPDDVEPLDFSGLVVSPAGTYYKIVTLDTKFCADGNQVYRMKAYEPQAYRVGVLTLPDGLVEICTAAFGICTNLTLSGKFPVSLKTIGNQAFCATKLSGDHVLTNLTSIGCAAFAGTKITSLEFGPKLTTVGTSYGRGFVNDCSKLTNLVFDATSKITKISTHTFQNCSALTELLLPSVGEFENWNKGDNSAFSGCSGIKRIGFGNVACIYPKTITGMANLEEVVFTDLPPTAVFTNYLTDVSSSKTITTYVHKKKVAETNSAGICWNDYAADGTISFKHTTWNTDYLVSGVDAAKRPLLTLEKPGLLLIVR